MQQEPAPSGRLSSWQAAAHARADLFHLPQPTCLPTAAVTCPHMLSSCLNASCNLSPGPMEREPQDRHWLDWDKRPRTIATDFFHHAVRNSSCTCAIARSGSVSMKLTWQPSPEILKTGEHRKSSPKLDMSSMPVTASSSQRLA